LFCAASAARLSAAEAVDHEPGERPTRHAAQPEAQPLPGARPAGKPPPQAAGRRRIQRNHALDCARAVTGRWRLRGDAVAGAAHGLHQRAGRAQRLAQALDVHVDRALLDEHVVAPDLVQQLLAAVHALGCFIR
jgi:hypothetical protein